MNKILFLFIFALLPLISAGSQELPKSEKIVPEEYNPEEYPLWLRDIRRFEVVSLGTFPISFFATSLVYDFVRLAENNFSADYSIGSQRANSDVEIILIASLGLSFLLGTIDLIINIVQRNKAEKASEEKNGVPDSPR